METSTKESRMKNIEETLQRSAGSLVFCFVFYQDSWSHMSFMIIWINSDLSLIFNIRMCKFLNQE